MLVVLKRTAANSAKFRSFVSLFTLVILNRNNYVKSNVVFFTLKLLASLELK